jgi:hypothetical protein
MVLAESESASVKFPGEWIGGVNLFSSSPTVPGRRHITCQSSGTDNDAELCKNFQQAGGCVGATIN